MHFCGPNQLFTNVFMVTSPYSKRQTILLIWYHDLGRKAGVPIWTWMRKVRSKAPPREELGSWGWWLATLQPREDCAPVAMLCSLSRPHQRSNHLLLSPTITAIIWATTIFLVPYILLPRGCVFSLHTVSPHDSLSDLLKMWTKPYLTPGFSQNLEWRLLSVGAREAAPYLKCFQHKHENLSSDTQYPKKAFYDSMHL